MALSPEHGSPVVNLRDEPTAFLSPDRPMVWLCPPGWPPFSTSFKMGVRDGLVKCDSDRQPDARSG